MSDLARLKQQLAASGLQAQNQALYQVLNQLIDAASGQQSGLTTVINNITGTFAPKNSTFITAADETVNLPNSRQMLAGTNIAFDDTVPNKRTLNVAAATPGGADGDYQFNNAGVFAGGEVKHDTSIANRTKILNGTNPQELKIFKTDALGADEGLLTTWATDFFAENCFSAQIQSAVPGAEGIELKTDAASISLRIAGAMPVLILYHDPTSNGGISLIPNGSGSIGHIYCDQSGSFMETPGGFGSRHMIDVLINDAKALLIGHNVLGADFILRMLAFITTTGAEKIEVGNNPGSGGVGSSLPFVIDASTNGLVANLPAAPPAGSMLYVTNALAPAMGAIVAGGGAAFAAVMWNGANWRVFAI